MKHEAEVVEVWRDPEPGAEGNDKLGDDVDYGGDEGKDQVGEEQRVDRVPDFDAPVHSDQTSCQKDQVQHFRCQGCHAPQDWMVRH